jgi:hypothetical protein|tara:strand:+ start:3869 stop:4273 length:405 start_codon:yes stop_codon:yes gene_type:complete
VISDAAIARRCESSPFSCKNLHHFRARAARLKKSDKRRPLEPPRLRRVASEIDSARTMGGLYVVKRDGREEPVAFDKITARIKKLAYGLSQEFCDPVRRRRALDAITTTGSFESLNDGRLNESARTCLARALKR